MTQVLSSSHPLVSAVKWDPAAHAERIGDFVLMSKGTSNSYLVTTEAGDVVINTGMPYQGARHRERYEALLGRPLDIRKIVLTQSHPDHIGGWAAFGGLDVETIVAANFPEIQAERVLLASFYQPRGARIVGGLMPNPEHLKAWAPEAHAEVFVAATKVTDAGFRFEVGRRRFEVHRTPSGETLDAVVVWMPDDGVVFTGNLLGALLGALPHYYTPRGDRDRSIPQSLRDIEQLIAWEPKLLITGHDEPLAGQAQVRTYLTRIRDAVRFLHDETVKAMNAGKDLWTMMQEIRLPAELETAPGRGPPHWYVRSIFEEYAGWFRHESTTELYATPPRAIWSELASMAGGPDALAARAQSHAAEGRALEALHFTDIALAVDPQHSLARRAEIAALELLLGQSGGRAYDEAAWLENAIREAKAALVPSPPSSGK